jgi:hypothetical protein
MKQSSLIAEAAIEMISVNTAANTPTIAFVNMTIVNIANNAGNCLNIALAKAS